MDKNCHLSTGNIQNSRQSKILESMTSSYSCPNLSTCIVYTIMIIMTALIPASSTAARNTAKGVCTNVISNLFRYYCFELKGWLLFRNAELNGIS